MSNELEEEQETEAEAVQWVASDDIELDEMCAEYRRAESQMKLHESAAKEIKPRLDAMAKKIQARMGEHKAVRTVFGYTVAWVPFKRKGYTVAAAEGERWQLRSPF